MRSFIITIIATFMLLIPTGAQDQWEIVHEGFDSGLSREVVNDSLSAKLNSIHIAEEYRWAVGENGLILKTKYASSSANSFMVVGDVHHYSPSPDFTQTMLYELSLAAIEEDVDFIFFPGDMGIRAFESPEEEESVLKDWRDVLETLQDHNIKLYACRGNNELSNRQSWDSLFSGTWAFPQNGPAVEKNITYAVEYDNLLFIVLDQYTNAHRINQAWLDSVLDTTTSDHIFVAGHEPAFKLSYTNCMGMYHCDRNLFWESLTDAGVRVYFCGHDHFYDHAIIYDGHMNPDNDLHQVMVGTGGGSLHADAEYDGENGHWTPERRFHEKEYGYVLVEVEGEEVKMTWKHRIGQNSYEDGGDSFIVSVGKTSPPEIPRGNEYLYNYPNPFHSSTTISYHLSEYSDVELIVYDLMGRKVSTLVNEKQPSGKHEIEWNPEGLKTGIYLCIFKAEARFKTIKMFVIQ